MVTVKRWRWKLEVKTKAVDMVHPSPQAGPAGYCQSALWIHHQEILATLALSCGRMLGSYWAVRNCVLSYALYLTRTCHRCGYPVVLTAPNWKPFWQTTQVLQNSAVAFMEKKWSWLKNEKEEWKKRNIPFPCYFGWPLAFSHFRIIKKKKNRCLLYNQKKTANQPNKKTHR